MLRESKTKSIGPEIGLTTDLSTDLIDIEKNKRVLKYIQENRNNLLSFMEHNKWHVNCNGYFGISKTKDVEWADFKCWEKTPANFEMNDTLGMIVNSFNDLAFYFNQKCIEIIKENTHKMRNKTVIYQGPHFHSNLYLIINLTKTIDSIEIINQWLDLMLQ